MKIYFYFKPDCHLCDAMDIALQQFISDLDSDKRPEIEMCDIEDDPNWYELYREYVPVLVINEEEICHYFFDHEALLTVISG